jgi:hypothetical protein
MVHLFGTLVRDAGSYQRCVHEGSTLVRGDRSRSRRWFTCRQSAEGHRPRTDDRRLMTVDRRPTTVDRRPTTDDRSTDDRRPTTDDRRPMTVDR